MRDETFAEFRERVLSEEEPQEEKETAWDALFGGKANAPTNRAQRRQMEQKVTREVRRNQRAYARRMKETKDED